MMYVYGLADDPGVRVGDCRGIGDAEVAVLAVAGVAALVSSHEGLGEEVRVADLRAHHRVLETLMWRCTVAPTRFGTWFASADDLEEVLEFQAAPVRQLLGRLRGHVELALRVQVRSEPRTEALAEACSALRDRCVASVVSRRRSDSMAAAFLVRADAVSQFERATARAFDGRPGLRASLTGPWPPYSFTEMSAFEPAAMATAIGAQHG